MKRYILIAGVNGAGKSTLYQSLSSLQGMQRVNTDEIVRTFGDWRNPQDIAKAGIIAVREVKQNFSQGISFNQETTLCGRTILKFINMAKERGYAIELHYIGVDSVDVAKARVLQRVKKGGHGIPEADIERRYRETFQNLNQVLPKCDITAFYDNTDKFRRFAIYKQGKPVRISQHVPVWFEKNVLQYGKFTPQ